MQNHKITAYQNTSILVIISFIYQIVLLPVLLNEIDGPTGWMSMVLAAAIIFVIVSLFSKVQKRYPEKTVIDLCEAFMPRWISKLVGLYYIIFFILASSILVKDFGEQVNMFMLRQTPVNLVMIIILLTGCYAAHKGISTIARIAHLSILIALIPLLIVMGFSIMYSSFTNYMPIWPIDYRGISNSLPIAIISIMGFTVFSFSNAYVNDTKKNPYLNKWMVVISCLLFVVSYFLIIFKFGVSEAKRILWPFMSILKFMNIPGSFIENNEALGLSLDMVCAFAALATILYFTNLSMQKTFDTEQNGYFIFIQIPIIYIIACLLPNMGELFRYIKTPLYVFCAINIIILILLIILNALNTKDKREVTK